MTAPLDTLIFFNTIIITKEKVKYRMNFVSVIAQCVFIPYQNLWKTKWEEIHEECDVFRYKINNIQEKVIDDKYLLQLNPDRNTNRRTPELIHDICQPFDDNKFNFTKVSPKEILFNLEKCNDSSNVHPVIVNVSPINRYHSLLCPFVHKRLPQVITEESLRLALEITFLAQNRKFRIGFNSLCALASINHLHFHLFLENHILPVEKIDCAHIKGPLYCFKNYPVPAFCFELRSQHSIIGASREIYKLLEHFLKNSLAHNIFITRGNTVIPGDEKSDIVRVIIWPRKSSVGVKQLHAFNVAVCELSGWFPIYSKEDYDKLTTKDLENELAKWKIDNFDGLCYEVQKLY